MVFHIHDCDLLSLIVDFSEGKLERAQKIVQIEDLLKENGSRDSTFDQSILDGINLSKIQNLAEPIKGILRDDHQFYDKNFRDILYLAYKNWNLYPKRKIEQYSYIKYEEN